ncbi:MAG: hypothetical protein GXO21_07550 [Aquificae bacterium]|nr:hypothetical protein [Aquificota bacterium]
MNDFEKEKLALEKEKLKLEGEKLKIERLKYYEGLLKTIVIAILTVGAGEGTPIFKIITAKSENEVFVYKILLTILTVFIIMLAISTMKIFYIMLEIGREKNG